MAGGYSKIFGSWIVFKKPPVSSVYKDQCSKGGSRGISIFCRGLIHQTLAHRAWWIKPLQNRYLLIRYSGLVVIMSFPSTFIIPCSTCPPMPIYKDGWSHIYMCRIKILHVTPYRAMAGGYSKIFGSWIVFKILPVSSVYKDQFSKRGFRGISKRAVLHSNIAPLAAEFTYLT